MCDKSRNTWLCVHWQWNTLEWCQLNALQASPVVHLVTPLSCVSLSMNTQPSVPAIFFLIQTCRTHCMCAACRSSESSPSVWSLSISISSTAQHWDSSPTCSKWPASGSRHSWGSNTRSTRSQCCIWYDWPSALTSYTGIIIWYQRQGFGLVPFWAHSIHHLQHTTGPTHQEAWSDLPSICRRYPALFSI